MRKIARKHLTRGRVGGSISVQYRGCNGMSPFIVTILYLSGVYIMAKKKAVNAVANVEGDDANGVVKRNFHDYVFEFHHPDGTVTYPGLVMHYPKEVAAVQSFLDQLEGFVPEGSRLRVCKKIYS
jgi:hypothetical protein